MPLVLFFSQSRRDSKLVDSELPSGPFVLAVELKRGRADSHHRFLSPFISRGLTLIVFERNRSVDYNSKSTRTHNSRACPVSTTLFYINET